MEKYPLDAIEIITADNPVGTILWMHGLGADGHDFAGVIPDLKLPKTLALRFIFPHAPVQPITINGGYPMRAWFDVHGLDRHAKQDEAGIQKSHAIIEQFIQQEIERGIPPEKIILAGFSQGGMMALYTGLRYEKSLGGLLALSSFLPLAEQLPQEASVANQSIPIFMAHGTADPILDISLAEMSLNILQQNHYQIEWHAYPMAHQVCTEELIAIGRWITSRYLSHPDT